MWPVQISVLCLVFSAGHLNVFKSWKNNPFVKSTAIGTDIRFYLSLDFDSNWPLKNPKTITERRSNNISVMALWRNFSDSTLNCAFVASASGCMWVQRFHKTTSKGIQASVPRSAERHPIPRLLHLVRLERSLSSASSGGLTAEPNATCNDLSTELLQHLGHERKAWKASRHCWEVLDPVYHRYSAIHMGFVWFFEHPRWCMNFCINFINLCGPRCPFPSRSCTFTLPCCNMET